MLLLLARRGAALLLRHFWITDNIYEFIASVAWTTIKYLDDGTNTPWSCSLEGIVLDLNLLICNARSFFENEN